MITSKFAKSKQPDNEKNCGNSTNLRVNGKCLRRLVADNDNFRIISIYDFPKLLNQNDKK